MTCVEHFILHLKGGIKNISLMIFSRKPLYGNQSLLGGKKEECAAIGPIVRCRQTVCAIRWKRAFPMGVERFKL
jgi:hypothetical protein